MKNLLFAAIVLCCSLPAAAQPIKKLSIDELDSYIAKSNKPLVVNFWATWCSSCVEEIPYFISTVKEKYSDQVELLLVSLDVKRYYPQTIKAFAEKRNFAAPIVWLNESNADVFCPRIDNRWGGEIPVTLFVNNGRN
ncbi:MAG: redoxin domain-containing protein, partial [Bacteroidetes bacterium]|nr:redoxin domain-containing protein [Bacteroidota bacterium]